MRENVWTCLVYLVHDTREQLVEVGHDSWQDKSSLTLFSLCICTLSLLLVPTPRGAAPWRVLESCLIREVSISVGAMSLLTP